MTLADLPDGARGRALALGLTAVLLAALWVAAVSPLLDVYSARADRLEQRQRIATRMQAVAASVPGLQRQVAALPPQRSPATIDGATDAIAAARLQQMIQDMAGQAGVTLITAETLPAEQAGPYRRVRVHLAVTGQWPLLVRLFTSVQQARPVLLLDDMQIGPAPVQSVEAAKPLQATFTVLTLRPAQSLRPTQSDAG